MDLYETLGVDRDATPAAVRAAWKKRSKDLHPDAGGSAKAFAKLSSAYMVLRDRERRARYDKTGETSKSEVDSDLKLISATLLALFDAAIKEGAASRKDIDVIKAMREFVKKEVDLKIEKVEKISDELIATQALRDRISSKEKRNLFGSVIEEKMRILKSSKVILEQQLRIIKMVHEELSNYSCLVEVVRMVEVHFVGAVSTSAGSF